MRHQLPCRPPYSTGRPMQVECGFPIPQNLVDFGPTLFVQIGFDSIYQPNIGNKPNLPTTIYPALMDTGATDSCIDSSLAANLNLPIVDRQNVAGVHGAHEVNMHLAQIHVPDLPFTVPGYFAAVHLRAGGQPHFALIGRTFLRDFKMIYDGVSGSVTLVRSP